MWRRNIIGLGTAIAMFGWHGAALATTVRFDDLPRLLRQRNLAVEGSEAFVAAADARTGHLPRSFLPTVSAFGGGETFHTLDQPRRTEPVGGITARVSLFEGGRDWLDARQRTAEQTLAQTDATKTWRLTLQRARDLFVEIVYLDTLRGLYASALQRNRQNIALVQKKIAAGLTTPTDQLDFEIEREALRQELALLSEDHEHAVELLQAWLGMTPGDPITIAADLQHRHTDPIFQARPDLAAHHDVAWLAHKSRATALEQRKTARWWAPAVELYGGYALHPFYERERDPVRERDELVAGVRARVLLFDGLQAHRAARALRHQARGWALQGEQRRRELRAFERKLQHTLALRHNLVHRVATSVAQTERYLRLTRQEYSLGTKNSPDVLQASQRVLDQQRRYADIRRDFHRTKHEMLTLLGE